MVGYRNCRISFARATLSKGKWVCGRVFPLFQWDPRITLDDGRCEAGGGDISKTKYGWGICYHRPEEAKLGQKKRREQVQL